MEERYHKLDMTRHDTIRYEIRDMFYFPESVQKMPSHEKNPAIRNSALSWIKIRPRGLSGLDRFLPPQRQAFREDLAPKTLSDWAHLPQIGFVQKLPGQ